VISLESPYQSYVYAYPHKTAYRPIEPPLDLRKLWEAEDKSALFLYLHIPFCEMRCGFCNLFTTVHPTTSLETAYLDTLKRQAKAVKAALGEASFARFAIGGGTPTYLTPDELHQIFDIAEDMMGAELAQIPISIETSPLTATPERLEVLRQRHVSRISIGVQSFLEAEVHAAGRAQKTADVHKALSHIRRTGVPTLNIDLIYGLPGQTVETWLESLQIALDYQPEELYLYPLYVRPLTGIEKLDFEWEDVRLSCYRAGRDYLLSNGYRQVSMRMFKVAHAPQDSGPVYCCQEDGMVGLGCGARSYTRHYHYATDYAVGRKEVLQILYHYMEQQEEAFGKLVYGIQLNEDDQRRRYILKSLLHATGLSLRDYQHYFGTDALQDYPLLSYFLVQGWIAFNTDILHLTESGFEYSDALGPMFYSEHVNLRMQEFALR
jgi:oxygen-independent coproporphyrinogen III oxidase